MKKAPLIKAESSKENVGIQRKIPNLLITCSVIGRKRHKKVCGKNKIHMRMFITHSLFFLNISSGEILNIPNLIVLHEEKTSK